MIETGEINSTRLPKGTKFYITSVVIHLLNLKSEFAGLPTNDAQIQIMDFVGIYTSYNLLKVS